MSPRCGSGKPEADLRWIEGSLEENFEEILGQVDQRLGKSETGAGGQLVTGRIKALVEKQHWSKGLHRNGAWVKVGGGGLRRFN